MHLIFLLKLIVFLFSYLVPRLFIMDKSTSISDIPLTKQQSSVAEVAPHTPPGLADYENMMVMEYRQGVVLLCGGKKQGVMSDECFEHVIGSDQSVVARSDLVMPFPCCFTLTTVHDAPNGYSFFLLGGRDETG